MPLTIAGINPSSSTIDHFRRQIYRPRLCLLLLLLLLSPHNAPLDTDSTAVSSDGPPSGAATGGQSSSSTEWTVSIIDGLVVAAPIRPASNPLSLHAPPSTPPQLAPFAALSSPPSNGSPAPSTATAPSQPTPASASSAEHRSAASSHDAQPAPGSLFKLPKPSWGLLIDSHVLPAVFTLHALWGIRFVGMAIEDGVVKSSLIGSRSRFHAFTLPLIQLSVLAVLALSIGTPPFIDAVAFRCSAKRASLGLETVPLGSARRQQTLLPIKLLVALELAAVLLSLVSTLFKIDDAALDFLPKVVRLPSPSHSPSIIELLPLPPGLAAALSGAPASSRSVAAGINRRPGRRPLIARAIQTGSEQAVASEGMRRRPETAASVGEMAAAPNADAPPTQATDDSSPRQQIYRQVGTDGREVLRSTSVTQPIAPLSLFADDPAPDVSSAGEGDADPRTRPATSPSATSTPRRRVKAPRLQHQRVLVTTRWLSDTVVSLFDKVVGSLLYAIVTLRLPTLSPTSLPPVLSLLSLRSELSSLTSIWSKARASVECLEFVRRRWGVELTDRPDTDPYGDEAASSAGGGGGKWGKRYKWMSTDEVTCSICFELTRPEFARPRSGAGDEAGRKWPFCRLDCGHELHDTCLVAWLTNQAFCPTCHCVLSFSPPPPPSPTSARRAQASPTSPPRAARGSEGRA
ncbi:uncharacterized protein PFL1_02743 [Pseudozyma flocculosa PF-1]|uniref:RING-type domain-containing protein n=2 Tax=Pseudozyma flocculosa TaxID=84751 RepID=A0A5C3F2G1_9BASI|nr:uncharacterized protein PFL1_02743 [Pseudozyma flocculosa PF-1]EPQ29524.1 hypothetical protein PFL1_02743 [Pseudozyma flocculosa PF-1]SPO38066.1 uncharacterized protein PSFLO_03543 [Pseudozyma flocculosa]